MIEWFVDVAHRLANAALASLALMGTAALVLKQASPWPWSTTTVTPRERAELDLMSLANALSHYGAQHGRFPTAAGGLADLVRERLMDTVPANPWGRLYTYLPGAAAYQLRSTQSGDDPALCFRSNPSEAEPRLARWVPCHSLLGAEARPASRAPFFRPSHLPRFGFRQLAIRLKTGERRLPDFIVSSRSRGTSQSRPDPGAG